MNHRYRDGLREQTQKRLRGTRDRRTESKKRHKQYSEKNRWEKRFS